MKLVAVVAFAIMIMCWAIFRYMFRKDRSRYRNCYMLFISLMATVLFVLCASGEYMVKVLVVISASTIIFLLIVPFFFIINGFVMIKREGMGLSHMLSLGLGLTILVGEIVTVVKVIVDAYHMGYYKTISQAVISKTSAIISISIIYVSMAFLIFIIYILFLQIIPKKNDFDYIIIHGSGLLDGDRVPKLLRDRLDKAIEIYKKAPNNPKLIPSGGKGSDETVAEADAMMKYLIEKGIPEEDIIPENKSETTYENLKNSKEIIESREGRKYTALVTSNYHVYRALRYCRKIELKCTGIGSRVAFYYWPSAMIREFIAIHAEKKHAVIMALGWLFWIGMIVYSWLPK